MIAAEEDAMSQPRSTLLSNVIAILIVAVACPVALFGGSMVGCVGQGFTSECAMSAIVLAPVLLLIAGVVAGIFTRGWLGLFLIWVGVAIGMSAILVLTYAVGRPVPLDIFAGAIATVWFLVPVWIGYAGARLVASLLRRTPEA